MRAAPGGARCSSGRRPFPRHSREERGWNARTATAGGHAAGPRRRGGVRAAPGLAPAGRPPVTVEVVNQNRADVNLYVLRGGTRTRLGTVVAGGSRTFRLRYLPG